MCQRGTECYAGVCLGQHVQCWLSTCPTVGLPSPPTVKQSESQYSTCWLTQYVHGGLATCVRPMQFIFVRVDNCYMLLILATDEGGGPFANTDLADLICIVLIPFGSCQTRQDVFRCALDFWCTLKHVFRCALDFCCTLKYTLSSPTTAKVVQSRVFVIVPGSMFNVLYIFRGSICECRYCWFKTRWDYGKSFSLNVSTTGNFIHGLTVSHMLHYCSKVL